MAGLFAAWLGSGDALARPEPLRSFGDWEAFIDRHGGLLCFMGATQLVDETGKAKSESSNSFVLITHAPGSRNVNIVRISFGQRLKPNAEVLMGIGAPGEEPHSLASHGDYAEPTSPETSLALIDAMHRASRVWIKAILASGREVHESFSLWGFKETYQVINRACGL